jgi:aspartate kinase
MKFGGAAVAHIEQFDRIAHIVLSRRQSYDKIAVVVSAMGDTTDRLISMAYQVNAHPPQREYDMLITVGERISCSLLAMALQKRGQKALSFTGSQAGILTDCEHTSAHIIGVKPQRLQSYLEEGHIAVIAGFQGVSQKAEITTLGRGGSDTSAVALAIALGATHVEFYKDVPGIFSQDPKKSAEAQVFSYLNYEQALTLMQGGAKILHARAVSLAAQNQLPLHVLSFNEFQPDKAAGTLVSSSPSHYYATPSAVPIYENSAGEWATSAS